MHEVRRATEGNEGQIVWISDPMSDTPGLMHEMLIVPRAAGPRVSFKESELAPWLCMLTHWV